MLTKKRTLLWAAVAATAMLTAQAFLLPARPAARPLVAPLASSSSSTAAAAEASEPPPARKYKTRFDPEKGARLASFSFAVYGNPSGSRFFRAKDGSDIGFHDDKVGDCTLG